MMGDQVRPYVFFMDYHFNIFQIPSTIRIIYQVAKGIELKNISFNFQKYDVMLDKDGIAPPCNKAIKQRQQLFPIIESYGENYININALYNGDGTGIMQKLKLVEVMIFDESFKRLEIWRGNKNFKQEIPEFYKFLDQIITAKYLSLFGI